MKFIGRLWRRNSVAFNRPGGVNFIQDGSLNNGLSGKCEIVIYAIGLYDHGGAKELVGKLYGEMAVIKIPKKVLDRFASTIKTFQSIANSHKSKDVSEADTVTLVKDILADTFGYDKYNELTSEQQIRGTFCDLAVKIEGKIRLLIEVKSAGIELNDVHLRQVLNYGANQGIEWVVLTNSIDWRLYRIKFGQPIDCEEVSAFNFLNVNLKNEEDQRKLFLLCRDGINTDAMDIYHQHAQLINKFTVAQVVLMEPVVSAIRREIRKLFPELKVEQEQVLDILNNDVLKREVIEGDKVKEVQQRIKKTVSKMLRDAEKKSGKDSKESLSLDPVALIDPSNSVAADVQEVLD